MDEIERILAARIERDPSLLEALKREHAALEAERRKMAGMSNAKSNAGPAELPWPVLQAEAYHGLAGEIVSAIDPFTEADPVAVLSNLLAGFGNLVGRGPHAKVLVDEHAARLFFVHVGETSGGRKGTAKGVVLKLLRAVDPEWLYRAGGLSSGEGLIWELRDKVMERHPVREKGRVVRYEQIETDPGQLDKRLFIIEPEFATVLKVMERQGNSLSGIFRQAWDGDDLSPMTKNNKISATGAHLSLVGHITQEELLRYLTETERANGFANRLVFLLVRRSKCIPNPKPIPESVLNPFIRRLREALEHSRTAGEVRRTDEAEREWAAVYEMLSERKPGMFGAIIGRAEAQVLRLSVVYALLDGSHEIRPEHQRAALALWEYAEQSARIIFGDATGNSIADTIMRALREMGEMDRTQINRLFGSHVPGAQIEAALALLRKAGMVCSERVETGGRQRELWRPAVP